MKYIYIYIYICIELLFQCTQIVLSITMHLSLIRWNYIYPVQSATIEYIE